ncbi:aminotransferase class I/II-fold pyridoxal phosphate-dependent enzyme [Caldicellulosiruptor naganoensis]|uniref:Aminotransferase class I/II-fold pyridoxal phosphate-dependent enzyme n=1 Tax=Caldicellulosiruptor naganoensis TaxID=29324 RepID=A0ABY7BIR8_9FIRM|nr:aminotransferase class I/II-fold pyridoxal phosphate-dependent enzyme [Caldicellulosiruptor naganoensis]WAM32738.1 aminotransferase class I/II-fold pyridoxal phosphate-dependent enzyme [Caldicellulosiruptor naganoensis]
MQEILNSLKIFNSLKNYNYQRFHMPGHKGIEKIFPNSIKNAYPYFDVTETIYTDDLLNPTSFLKEFLENINSFFNSRYSFLSLQGSTHLLQSCIATFSKPFGSILINRDAHKSIYNIARILKLDIEYIYPEYDSLLGVYTYIDKKEFEKTLKKTKSEVVIITSPSYYGINQDIKTISALTKKYNKKLIVDQAHGGYYKFVGKETALDEGADICIMSLHKTLPCPNQSALLLSNLNDNSKLNDILISLHTSSPSYVLLLWSEYGIEFSKRFGEDLYYSLEKKLRELSLPVLEYTNYHFKNIDILKLLFNFDKLGFEIEDIKVLLSKYSIVPEAIDRRRILFYFSFIDSLSNFENLKSFFCDIIKRKEKIERKRFSLPPRPKKIFRIYEVDDYKKTKVKLKDAVGLISAKAIIPYPPGCPVVVEGEIIDKDTIEYLAEILGNHFIEENEVDVIDER